MNGKDILAMIDTGATHNFIKDVGAKKLGLQIQPSGDTMKTVNSAALESVGVIKDAQVSIGSWNGKVDLLAVKMDDYDVKMDDYDLVLGNKFFNKAKALVAPHLGGILIGDETSPCFVHAKSSSRGSSSNGMLSSLNHAGV